MSFPFHSNNFHILATKPHKSAVSPALTLVDAVYLAKVVQGGFPPQIAEVLPGSKHAYLKRFSAGLKLYKPSAMQRSGGVQNCEPILQTSIDHTSDYMHTIIVLASSSELRILEAIDCNLLSLRSSHLEFQLEQAVPREVV